MKKILLTVAALAFCAPALAAAPPTEAQLGEFSKLCLKNSGGNGSLCKCKVEQAKKLLDGEFMAVVLTTMEGKSLTEAQNKPYGIYISRSNQVCAPGM